MIYIFFFCNLFFLLLFFFLNSKLEEKEKEIIELKRPLAKHVQIIPHYISPIDYCYRFEIPENEFIHWRQFLKKNDNEPIDKYVERGIYDIAKKIKEEYEIQIQVIPQIDY